MKTKIYITTMIFFLGSWYHVYATDQVVTNNNDAGAGSLRQAIIDAGDGDGITFNLTSGNEVIVISSELAITESLTINGANTAGSGTAVTVQVTTPGTSTYRVFNISGSGKTINISYMTIKGGDVSLGGGISIITTNTVTLYTVTISDSKAGSGGGIYNKGTLSITSSTISGNSVTSDGGGIYNFNGAISISNSTISGNSATSTGGGINLTGGSISIHNSILTGNGNNDYSYTFATLTDNGYNVVGYSTRAANAVGGFNSPTSILYNTKYNTAGTSFTSWTQGGTLLTNQTLGLSSTLALNSSTNGTYTLALSASSFAATAIPSASSWNSSPATDQRGFSRPAGINTSIGAYSYVTSATIPTLSEWGLIILAFLLLSISTVVIMRRKRTSEIRIE